MNGLIYFILILKFTYIIADLDEGSDLDFTDAIQSITLYHQLSGSGAYLYRGVIAIYNPSTFANNIQQNLLTKEEYDLVAASADNGELYKLKYVVKSRSGKEDTFHSFIKSSKIIEANLTDTIEILTDQSQSKIISFNHIAPRKIGNTAAPISFAQPSYSFRTTVKFNNAEKGPVPDITTFLTKLQREKDARKASKDNRPFLAKYWYYIVPVLVVVLFAGSPMGNQEGAGR